MRIPRLPKRCAAAVAALGLLAACTSASAADVDMYDGNTHYSITPYLWFPGIRGTFNFTLPPAAINRPPSESTSGQVNPSSYLSDLQFAIMLAGEVRKGDWALATDFIYLDLASLQSKLGSVQGPGGRVDIPINADVNLGLRGLVWTLIGSRTMVRNDSGTLDALAGFRYAGIHSSLDWNAATGGGLFTRGGSTSANLDLYDGIVGVRGRVRLTSDGSWFMPYYADIGAGNQSNWTWQAYIGLGYKFGWGDVALTFRNLSYNQGSNRTLESLDLTGPALSASFRW